MTIGILLVLLSGLVHAVWNLFAKKSTHKAAFLWHCQWVAILLYMPAVVLQLRQMHVMPSATGWLLLVATMLLHGLYVWLLARTYTVGDLSQVYPVMRGMSPLLVPLIGILVLGEHLPLIGWIGVIAIISGISLLGRYRSVAGSRLLGNGMGYALAVGLMITSYTVLDKVAVVYVPPLVLNSASNVGNLAALSWTVFRSGRMQSEWRAHWRTIVIGGVLAPGGYVLFLWALTLAPVAQLAPIREVGIVFGTLLGIWLLREPQGLRRMAASALIAGGIILLAR